MPLKRDSKVLLSSGGKGGVGKSLLAAATAITMAGQGYKVGTLDLDIRAPNLHYVLGLKGKQSTDVEGNPYPLEWSNGHGEKFYSFSSSMIFGNGKSIMAQGEQMRSMISDLIYGVKWPDLDYLIADLDPSSGDALRAVTDLMGNVAAYAVTSSDVSSLQDCRRMLDSFRILGVRVVGVVANMVISECPRCGHQLQCMTCGETVDYGHTHDIEAVAEEYGTKVIGRIPWNPLFKSNPIAAIRAHEHTFRDIVSTILKEFP